MRVHIMTSIVPARKTAVPVTGYAVSVLLITKHMGRSYLYA